MSDETKIAVINISTGLVENIAVIKDGDGSTAPEGFLFVASDEAAIGDSFDGKNIVKAPEPIHDTPVDAERLGGVVAEPVTPAPVSRDEFDALSARVTALESRAGV